MLRDKIDYETNDIYIWKCGCHWRSSSQAPSGYKNVSFSDMESNVLEETFAASDFEGSPTRPTTSNLQEGAHTPGSSKNGQRR